MNHSKYAMVVTSDKAMEIFNASLKQAYQGFSAGFHRTSTSHASGHNSSAYSSGKVTGKQINLNSKRIR
jgi:hypothetical protein